MVVNYVGEVFEGFTQWSNTNHNATGLYFLGTWSLQLMSIAPKNWVESRNWARDLDLLFGWLLSASWFYIYFFAVRNVKHKSYCFFVVVVVVFGPSMYYALLIVFKTPCGSRCFGFSSSLTSLYDHCSICLLAFKQLHWAAIILGVEEESGA